MIQKNVRLKFANGKGVPKRAVRIVRAKRKTLAPRRDAIATGGTRAGISIERKLRSAP